MTTEPQRAILAGGCFWGMQDLIRSRPGVLSTRVGYTGGDTPNATYRNHGSHAEAIEITYDPAATTYRDLLALTYTYQKALWVPKDTPDEAVELLRSTAEEMGADPAF